MIWVYELCQHEYWDYVLTTKDIIIWQEFETNTYGNYLTLVIL
jgi:hypothetical protein